VIIERALEEGLDSPVVYVTRHHIAHRLHSALLLATGAPIAAPL
jgi:hypothetical protein